MAALAGTLTFVSGMWKLASPVEFIAFYQPKRCFEVSANDKPFAWLKSTPPQAISKSGSKGRSEYYSYAAAHIAAPVFMDC
jgi:hypothetical protein